ncbi:MAG: PAS domain-containing sensor histidine kinase [Archangium sp.]
MEDSSLREEHTRSGKSALARAFERAPVALVLVERDGRLGAPNARCCALTGYDARKLHSLSLWDLVHPAELASGRDRLRSLLEGRAETRCAELRCLRADGAIRQFLFRITALEEEDRGTFAVASIEDVTEQHREEADRTAAMHALSTSIERVTDGFVALDKEWRYVYLNHEGARLLGRTPEQLLGKQIWTEFPNGIGQPFHLAYERAMQEQLSIAIEDYSPPFGRWFENRIYPSPEGLSIYFHDITERVKIREQLEQFAARQDAERRWLEALLKHMPTPLMLLQPHTGRVSLANEAAVQLVGSMLVWGGAGNGELGGTWSDASGRVLSPEELPPARVARGERLENLQLLCHSPSGPRWLLCNSAHLPAQEDHPAFCVLAFQDITQLKRVESELARAVHERDEFLSVAAHELRTPLTSLTLQLQALVRQVRTGAQRDLSPEQVTTRAESLLRGLARLTKLVQNLLDISRLRGGRLVLECEDVDASRLVRDVVGRLGEELAWAHCPMELQVQPGVVGRWDVLRLEQVVTNLVTNAAKYGRGKPIEITLEQKGGRAYLSVRDHGIGIAAKDQARIFEPFERAVSSRHYGGFGLGLWIVRQIIESMGGTIRVESLPGKGSTFTVELDCTGAREDWTTPDAVFLHH